MTETDGDPKVLIVGALPTVSQSVEIPIGGAEVNFEEMVRQLLHRRVELAVVDINRPRQGHVSEWQFLIHNVMSYVQVMWKIARCARRYDLIFLNINPGWRGSLVASCIWALCKLILRPMVLRFFGGDFSRSYDASGRLARRLADMTYLKCPLILVQTREILRYFRSRGNVRWFPNTRDVVSFSNTTPEQISRLLFISRLSMDKGLGEVLAACRDLREGCHLDVYGPPMPDTDFSLFAEHERATYRGELRSAEVPHVMAEYHLLLLPSYWEQEGYPGVVLEALQCGLPVVTTRWRAIPEVVEHERSGLLVEPQSAAAVREAIERLREDPDLYRKLCRGARERGEFFRSGQWYDRLVADLRRLARRTLN